MQYIHEAVRYNHNLREAKARVWETRALRTFAAGKRLPNIKAVGSYNRSRIRGDTSLGKSLIPNGLERNTDHFQTGFDALWELDLFGGTRRAIAAADARWQGAVEEHRDVLVTVIAEVARNYMELRGTQQR